jgi:hypothetical protein
MLSTPTSKIAEKKSATKEMEIANDGLDSLDDIEISATKPTGKRSANLDEGQVVATKETKIACVKNKSTKKKKYYLGASFINPYVLIMCLMLAL